MILIFLVILTTSLVVLWYLWWRKVKGFWKARGVSFLEPHPVWGSLTFLQRENPAIWMRKVYDHFKAPYVGMWVFWRPALVINCPEIGRRIFVKDFDNFRNRYLGSGKTDPVGGLNLFTVNDPLWSSMRRRLTVIFTASKLKALQPLIENKTRDLVDRINKEMARDTMNYNLRELYSDFTTDVFGEAAFGVTSESTKTKDSVLRKVTRDFMRFSIFRGLSWSSIFFMPDLVDIFGFSFFPKNTVEYLRQIMHSVVEQRGGFDRKVHENKDMLDALIKIRQESGEGEFMSEDLILAQASIFLLGAFDTSSATLTWMTIELAHQPWMQEKLFNEILDAKTGVRDKDFDPAMLTELPFMKAVIKETLRKYPPLGWYDRIAAEDYKIDDNLTIPAGTIVYINGVGMHYDPEFYPNPEKFDPERFMPSNEAYIKPHAYLPFGDGPRSCIGKRFANQLMYYAVYTIFLNYFVEPLPVTPKAEDIKVENKGMFYFPDQKLQVRFIPRNNEKVHK